MDSIEDLLRQKAQHLDYDSKRSALDVIQMEVERYFKSGVRVSKVVSETEVVLVVSNPSLATDVRYRQMALLDAIRSVAPKVEKIRVSLF